MATISGSDRKLTYLEESHDLNYGMFVCGCYQDTVTTFENKAIAMPLNLNTDPDNAQLMCIDLSKKK